MPLMKLQFPAERISGRLAGNGTVNTWNRGQQVLRAFNPVPNPDSTDQQAVRTALSLLTKNWKTLTTGQTNAWDAFAVANPIVNRLGNTVSRTGLSAYVELGTIQYFRTGVLPSAAPTLPRPAPATSIAIPGSQNGGTTIFLDITHSLPSIVNIWWLVKLTPNLPSVKVVPSLSLYRMVQGVNNTSFIAAAASVDNVSFTSTKYTYDDQMYIGAEVSAVNAEGWASLPIRTQGMYLI